MIKQRSLEHLKPIQKWLSLLREVDIKNQDGGKGPSKPPVPSPGEPRRQPSKDHGGGGGRGPVRGPTK